MYQPRRPKAPEPTRYFPKVPIGEGTAPPYGGREESKSIINNKSNKTHNMKTILKTLLLGGLVGLTLTSCENGDPDFPDFDYSTVYFSRQTPIRTVVLGNDENADNTLDNNHQIEIYARIGGKRAMKGTATVGITVDPTLCQNLYFADGMPVKAMPESYYKLESDKIVFSGNMESAVKVQLTDAFFADPASVTTTYVIPIRMTSVEGVDSILSGTPKRPDAKLTNPDDWDVKAKNYILYCVNFVNPYSGIFLRRGVDVVDGKTTVRHKGVEKDEVFTVTTTGMQTVTCSVANGVKLQLTFAADGSCTVSSATEGVTANGKGHFGEKAEKKAWGDKDRDAIYLDYQWTKDGVTTATKDTLVARDRGVKVLNPFSPVYK